MGRRGREGSDEKREERRKKQRGAAGERDKEKSVGMVRGERNTPGAPNHGIVEPLGPGALFNKSQLMRVIDHRGMR